MRDDPDQAAYYDGLQSAHQELQRQFDQQELDLESQFPIAIKEALKLPRGTKMPETTAGEGSQINNETWSRATTPDA